MQPSAVLALILILTVSCRLNSPFVEANLGDKTEGESKSKPLGDDAKDKVADNESKPDAKLADPEEKNAEPKKENAQPDVVDPAEEERDREAGFIIKKVKTVKDCKRYSKEGDTVYIHYTGKLASTGEKFDSSRNNKGRPFKFVIGSGEVIPGWDKGVRNMCVGDKRLLTIPPHLGYGDEAMGTVIPANSTLKFQIEMIDIKDAKEAKNIFKEIDIDGDNQLSQEEVSAFIRHQEVGQHEVTEADQIAHDKIIAEIFGKEDTNKDGVISHEEFSGPKHEEL